MGAKVIMLANPYTYKFLKGLTHSALDWIGWKWKDWNQLLQGTSIKQESTLILHFRKENLLFPDRGGNCLCVFVYKIWPILTRKTHMWHVVKGYESNTSGAVVSWHCEAVSCSDPRFCRPLLFAIFKLATPHNSTWGTDSKKRYSIIWEFFPTWGSNI